MNINRKQLFRDFDGLTVAAIAIGIVLLLVIFEAGLRADFERQKSRMLPAPQPTSRAAQESAPETMPARATAGLSAHVPVAAVGGARQVRMNVSAYCPCKACCGPRARGVTASGRPVSANRGLFVAADRSVPFGAIIRVPGYAGGVGVPVLDRGGAIRGNSLDVYFPTHRQARQWGRKTLTVEILS